MKWSVNGTRVITNTDFLCFEQLCGVIPAVQPEGNKGKRNLLNIWPVFRGSANAVG